MLGDEEMLAYMLHNPNGLFYIALNRPKSPCIGKVCSQGPLKPGERCSGCDRTIEEIVDSFNPTKEQREAALSEP